MADFQIPFKNVADIPKRYKPVRTAASPEEYSPAVKVASPSKKDVARIMDEQEVSETNSRVRKQMMSARGRRRKSRNTRRRTARR